MMKTIKRNRSIQGMGKLEGLKKALIRERGEQDRRRPSRRVFQVRRSQAGYFRKFGLEGPEAHRISWFIYLVNGEGNQAFLSAMECWVREIALAKGSVLEILDAITILAVCRIDYDRVETCASVRREVIRYVQRRFGSSAGMKTGLRVPVAA